MKNIRCTACGAPNITTKLCEYCGANLPTTQSLSKTNKGEFDLALFEFNRGEKENLEKALSLFEKIIITDPNNQAAWLYKFLTEFKLDGELEEFLSKIEIKNDLKDNPLFTNEVLYTIRYLEKGNLRKRFSIYLKHDVNQLLKFSETCNLNFQNKLIDFLYEDSIESGHISADYLSNLLTNQIIITKHQTQTINFLKKILSNDSKLSDDSLLHVRKMLAYINAQNLYPELQPILEKDSPRADLASSRALLKKKIFSWENSRQLRLKINALFSSIFYYILYTKYNVEIALLVISLYNTGFTFYSSYRIYSQSKRVQQIDLLLSTKSSEQPPKLFNWRLIGWVLWLALLLYNLIFDK